MKYNTIEEGLTDLHKQMSKGLPKWTDEITTYFKTRLHVFEEFSIMDKKSLIIHNGWIDLRTTVLQDGMIDATFMMLSMKQLAEHYGVPQSWIYCMGIKPVADLHHRTWVLPKLHNKLFKVKDKDGSVWLRERVYAAYLDGIDAGVVEESALDLSSLRHPQEIKLTEHIKSQYQQHAEFHDMGLEDFLQTLNIEHEMTLA